MAANVIDVVVIASTTQAEAALKKVGKEAESSLGSSGSLGKAGKGGEAALSGVGKAGDKAGKDVVKGLTSSKGAMSDLKGGAGGLLQSFTGLSLGTGAVIAGFAVVGLAAKGVLEEFNKNTEANLILNQAMRDSGQKVTPAFTKALEDVQHAGENLGFQQSDSTQTMANLTLAGLKQKDVFANLALIQDLARAKNISLADASEVFIKGVNGMTRGLKDYNIIGLETIPTTAALVASVRTLARDHAAAAVDLGKYNLAVKKHGAASKQAIAAHEKWQAAIAKTDHQQAINNTTMNIAAVRAHNLKVMHEQLAEKVGGQATAATHSLGVEWQIISAKFNDFAGQAIPKIQQGIASLLQVMGQMVNWVVANVMPSLMPVFAAIGNVIKALIPVFKVVFPIIVGYIKVMLTILSVEFKIAFAIIGTYINIVIAIIKTIAGVLSAVFSVVGHVVSAAIAPAKAVIDGIITAINAVIGVIDAIQVHIHFGPVSMDWNGLRIPKIPMLDAGGIVSSPTLAMLAMNSKPEAIIPLSSMKGGGRGGDTYHIETNVASPADPNAISRAVVFGLRSRSRASLAIA